MKRASRQQQWLFLALIAVSAAVLVVRGRGARVRTVAAVETGLRYADSLRQMRLVPDSGTVLSALYLERARLGVGSPFRLIEYVLRDRRIDPRARHATALAILAGAARGDGYATPVQALNLLSIPGNLDGEKHRAFIEARLEGATDPWAMERALRLAYQLAVANGTVSHRAGAVSVSAIAQARDRALSMRDAANVIRSAAKQRMDPVELVASWRVARRFQVERPLLGLTRPSQDDEISALLPGLVADLAAIESFVPTSVNRDGRLRAEFARVAVGLTRKANAPPQAPIIVTMSGFGAYVVGAANRPGRDARSEFVGWSRSEESLVAEFSLLQNVTRDGAAEAALALTTAAVAMRTYAQERAWMIGDGAPAAVDVQTRLGLASLSFDKSVAESWRPYYVRMLDGVVADLKQVVPNLDLRGLHVRFGVSPLRDRALALHDPATRTVYFPAATSAGAMAHELAHDLDWQAARKRYGVTTGYRTDRSVRQYRDGLASTLERLAATSPRRSAAGANLSPERPTEAFARGADWIIASALARRGIVNGYLSAVQDEVLTGYASAAAPRGDTPEGDATLAVLSEIVSVDPDARRWLDDSYGAGWRMGVAEGVRRVLTAPVPCWEATPRPGARFNALSASRLLIRDASRGTKAWACQLTAPSLKSADHGAIVRSMELAARERAKGLVRRWGDYSRTFSRSSERFRALGGAPWNPAVADEVIADLEQTLLWRAARVDDGRSGFDLVERAERSAAWRQCAGAQD